MAAWNSGALWSSGLLWGPQPEPGVISRKNIKNKRTTMKRNEYYPNNLAQRPEWHTNLAAKVQEYATELTLSADIVNNTVADNLTLAYGYGVWITNVRDYSPACTAALVDLATGTGGAAFAFPTLAVPAPPTLPVGADPVLPGALDRTFKLVQEIKAKPGYTEAIGLDMGIVGSEDAAEHTAPEISLKTEPGQGCQCVKVRFKKFGHYAVAIYSKRGADDWELLGIDKESPYQDERPLLVAGQPEVRQYKARFWDAGAEGGDWTDVASITVT